MKTKVITLLRNSEPVFCAVLRWDVDPTTTEDPKVYVNYFYPFSVAEISIDSNRDNDFLHQISLLVVKYCNKHNLRLWSY